MRIFLLIWLLILWTQDVRGSTTHDSSIEMVLTRHQQKLTKGLLGLPDLWNSVKQSAKNNWESVKNIAKHSVDRISNWIQTVKAKAIEINISFKKRLEDLKKEINALITNVKVTGDVVKQCIRKEQETIDDILKGLLKGVTTCISQSIQSDLLVLEIPSTYLMDKTEFIINIEKKMYMCLNKDDIEECLVSVRKTMYDELDKEEQDILKNRDETRARIDDILNTIASCASNGLIEASSAVTNTTIQVIKCITKG